MDLRFRRPVDDDLDRMVEIHLAAYPDERGVEQRRRNLAANALGDLGHMIVAERSGDIVGQAFLFALEAWFGGRRVKLGGVASVAVAPEARGRGIARALLGELHTRAARRGDAITMLYAFRQGYYAALGYAPASPRRRLALDPRAIPASYGALGRTCVRRARPEDHVAIRRAYGRMARRSSGWLVRPEALWARFEARDRRQVLVVSRGHGGVAGYVAFELSQREPHTETRLGVDEMVYDDDRTRRALFGALGSMRDQVAEIDVELDETDPLDRVLLDPDRRRFGTAVVEHTLGTLIAGPMVRITNPTRAVEARGYPADASFDLHLEGDERALGVRIQGGRATCGAARRRAVLGTTRAGLSAMLYGGLRPSDAVRLGLADADAKMLERLDPALAMPPVFAVDAF
jgi:predicted acetyltransferase